MIVDKDNMICILDRDLMRRVDFVGVPLEADRYSLWNGKTTFDVKVLHRRLSFEQMRVVQVHCLVE